MDCSGLMVSLDSDNVGTQTRSFDRLMINSPSTATSKVVTVDTQAVINQTILKQLSVIGDRLDKIEGEKIKKSLGPHKSKGTSAVTKNTKVVRQSDSTHINNHSTGRHANVKNTHTVPSTVSIPKLERLRANDNIQKYSG